LLVDIRETQGRRAMSRRNIVALVSMLVACTAIVNARLGEADPSPFTPPAPTVNANATGPGLSLRMNRFAFEEGLVHALSAGVSVGSPLTGDLYLVLRVPTGHVFSVSASGDFVPGLFPLARNVSLPSGFQVPMQAVFLGQLPALVPGPYTWFGGFTRPGTLQLIGNVAQADWHFLPTLHAEAVVTLENGYRITFVGVTANPDGTSTWRYRVEELPSAQDLSNWVLELPACAHVLAAAPEPWELVRPDPNAGLFGIKWQTGAGFHEGEFGFVLSGHWPIGAMRVAAKGPDVAFGTILGPVCEELVELALQKAADPATARPGDELAYTITLQNVGTTAAEAVVLTDPIPLGTTFVVDSLQVTAGFGQFLADENLVFWQGDLAPGAVLTVTFRVTVQSGVATGSTIVNRVFAGAEEVTADVVIVAP